MEPLLAAVLTSALALGLVTACYDAPLVLTAPVATRALALRSALALAATGNLVGAILGIVLGEHVVATLVALVTPLQGGAGVGMVLAAVLGAAGSVLVGRRSGWTTSATLALVGGLLGAAAAASAPVARGSVTGQVLTAAVLGPLLAVLAAHALALVLQWAFRHANPGPAFRRLRSAQVATMTAVALAQGLQGSQRTTAVVVLALVAAGRHRPGDGYPGWVIAAAATALALGTALGGWRLAGRPLRRPVAHLDPPRAAAADAVAASLLVGAAALGAPLSTTHTHTAAHVGASTTRGASGVQWRAVRRAGVAAVLTVPVSAALAATASAGLSALQR